MVIDTGEGQQWNRARRIHPKSRALGVALTRATPSLPFPLPLVHPGPKIEFSQQELVIFTTGTSRRFFSVLGVLKKKKE